MKEIHELHGFPTLIVSDRDPKFIGIFWKELWNMSGTTLVMISTYRPQIDGQIETINKCLEGYLCVYYLDK
jgi:hypothetical protein